jgi:hypothetical protein
MTAIKRPLAAVVLGAAGIAVLATCVLTGIAYSSARRADTALTERALATSRREAEAPRPAAVVAEPSRVRVCPEGAEGLAVAAGRALGAEVLRDGALDVAAVGRISNAAIAAARYLERARAAPALPQRLGRERDGKGGWKPLTPAAVGCATVPVIERGADAPSTARR